jgi:hypothetical protein
MRFHEHLSFDAINVPMVARADGRTLLVRKELFAWKAQPRP